MADQTPVPKKSFKQKTLDYIGHDPVITDAASATDTLMSGTRDLPTAALNYVDRLFPFTKWILNYNLTWLTGDVIAGLTVGLVVVPQSMSYAKIATLAPEYGLYSSFVGVMIYALFATSKDVTIGPVAVMSLQVSKVISHVQDQAGGDVYSGPVIASTLALICGIITIGIGLLRIGWLVEFIPAVAVSAFMTGSAISIAAGQVGGLMGYASKYNTRAETYKVIINSLKFLPSTKLDAAYGLTGLAFLYIVRAVFGHFERHGRTPMIRKLAFFANTLRTAFVIIFLTLAAWLHLRNKAVADFPISVLKTVPSGFQHMGVPVFTTDLLGRLGPQLPVSTIILLLEHIAISKSFGRVNNYKIDPNQELIAIGVTNIATPFFGGYPATGSFSRTAIKSKAGVRTPIAGWITGIVVIIALFALTDAFFWIPNAALSAVIIHAVGDLIASPKQVYGFWLVSPIEAIIWFAGVIITIFTTIEIGIYVSVGASIVVLLFRIALPRGSFLGRVRVRADDEGVQPVDATYRDVYVPLKADGVRNPLVKVLAPPPGVIVFRMEESFVYPNASRYMDQIADYAREFTRSGTNYDNVAPGDRPWNDPGPNYFQRRKAKTGADETRAAAEATKPILRAVVFDFSSVSNIDSTSVQNLVDLRRFLERYAGGPVVFHFASILSPWIKRALLAGGFGRGIAPDERPLEIAAIVPAGTEHAEVTRYFRRQFPGSPPPGRADKEDSLDVNEADLKNDLESASSSSGADNAQQQVRARVHAKSFDAESVEQPIVSPLAPRFFVDLSSAVAAAVGDEQWS
ncbi:Sulfate permease 2 [Microbotryomycetes sp. JL221]|nr:Sulfate permease 2 [Microbotryomycetes sp. JL221]